MNAPKILFIEDEADRMKGVVKVLSSAGYEINSARTASEALLELRLHWKEYAIAILDLMLPSGNPTDPKDELPEMPGEKVGEEIYRIRPILGKELPVIILTAMRTDMDGMEEREHRLLLRKPVNMQRLVKEVEKLANEKPMSRI